MKTLRLLCVILGVVVLQAAGQRKFGDFGSSFFGSSSGSNRDGSSSSVFGGFNQGGSSSSSKQGRAFGGSGGSSNSFNSGGFSSFQKPQQQNRQSSAKSSNVNCPEKNGRFPTRTCDGYIECEEGVGEEKLCPDGLLFNPAAGIFSFPCQYPLDVDCTGREQTQPAQATDDCPHQYGYYRIGGAAECGQFKNCVDGRGFVFDCPEGLAFNEASYRCDWPDEVESCDAAKYLGFSCPEKPQAKGGLLELEGAYRSYRKSDDCQRYFVCVNDKPRLYNCGEERAFNELTNLCDGVANVTGCSSSRSSSSGSPSSYFGGSRGGQATTTTSSPFGFYKFGGK